MRLLIAMAAIAAVASCASATLASEEPGILTLVAAGKLPPTAKPVAMENPDATAKTSEIADGHDAALDKHTVAHDTGANDAGLRSPRIQADLS